MFKESNLMTFDIGLIRLNLKLELNANINNTKGVEFVIFYLFNPWICKKRTD